MKLSKEFLKYIPYRNERSRNIYLDEIKKLEEAKKDSRKKERLEKHECKTCFYIISSRIGAAVCTTRPCAICETEMDFCNSNTDCLCVDCARKHKLCKHCMADIELRSRRKEGWPKD